MSGNENIATTNLEFFKTAIFEPALEHQQIYDEYYPGRENETLTNTDGINTVSDFGVVEAALWLRLGAQIGYFDEKSALELLSSLKSGVFKAWSNLEVFRNASAEIDWTDVIQWAEGAQTTKKEWFPGAVIGASTRDLLHSEFQTFLLLTSENILDHDSRYFLDSIGWTSDLEWNVRKRGTLRLAEGSVSGIGIGFGNVLNYWEEMEAIKDDISERQWPVTMRPNAVAICAEEARVIMTNRFNLSENDIVERYFVLGGEFANRAKEDNPTWLDARLDLFEKLISLIEYASGRTKLKEDETRLWNLFTEGFDNSRSEVIDEIRPTERRKEPPEEGLLR